MIGPKKIIRSKRKTLSLQITESGELIVRVPKFVSDLVVQQFIEKHRNWIDDKIQEILIKKSQLKIYTFNEGEEFLFIGRKYTLKLLENSFVQEKGSIVSLSQNHLLIYSKGKRLNPKWIENFYKNEARKIFEERAAYYLNKFNQIFNSNLSYKKIKLSKGKKILGSCSPKGYLNFSWRLIQAPLEIIDYVVVHEIVHLKEKNHNRAFWSKVKALKPDYKENMRWLRDNWYFLKDFLGNKKIGISDN